MIEFFCQTCIIYKNLVGVSNKIKQTVVIWTNMIKK